MKKWVFSIFLMIVPLTSIATVIDEGVIHFINSIIQNQVEEVDIYLEGDNSPDIRDRQGNPAIVVAATYKRLRVVRILLEWQANPNLMSANGMTALMVAASRKHQSIMRLLLQHRADVNLQNPYNGYTALMYVIEKNYANGVQLLVDYRANINLRNTQGETALTIAQARGYDKIVDILLAGPRRTDSQSEPRTDARSSTTPSPSSSTITYTEAYISQADTLVNQGLSPYGF
ncbi:Ankyrin [Beggiatoa sp. PS]|nr:Ankyrin [Beggiatoa sp. PS]